MSSHLQDLQSDAKLKLGDLFQAFLIKISRDFVALDLQIWSCGFSPNLFVRHLLLRTWSAPILLEELHVLLQCEEPNLESIQSTPSDTLPTAMVASKEGHKYNRGGRSNFRGRGRGSKPNTKDRGYPSQQGNPTPQSNTKLCYQICNWTGQTALDWYHRMDYSFQGRHPPSQLAAMAASFHQKNESQWCQDYYNLVSTIGTSCSSHPTEIGKVN
ncbi:hypothetical protein MRB53_002422 [Persea americana]|uniref:Uncharacterized protein n=1 Tax=Persea americana TaxID=3435 RepID=A0ACC2MUN7_PERAE|nr:hypothetical protein MRB53_002422 [Persea americana]